MGPTEAAIEAAFDETEGQVYSWSWEFQPFQPEYDLPRQLTRRQALRQIREWRVFWADQHFASLAREMLFDDTGFIEQRTLFGLIKRVELRPIEGVDLVSSISPLKLQSVRSALTFKMQAQESFPQLVGCRTPQWSRVAAGLLRGDFVEVGRQGWFTAEAGPRGDAQCASHSNPSSLSPLRGDLVERARELAGSDRCVAFIPAGKPVVNDSLPVEPWEWLETLRC